MTLDFFLFVDLETVSEEDKAEGDRFYEVVKERMSIYEGLRSIWRLDDLSEAEKERLRMVDILWQGITHPDFGKALAYFYGADAAKFLIGAHNPEKVQEAMKDEALKALKDDLGLTDAEVEALKDLDLIEIILAGAGPTREQIEAKRAQEAMADLIGDALLELFGIAPVPSPTPAVGASAVGGARASVSLDGHLGDYYVNSGSTLSGSSGLAAGSGGTAAGFTSLSSSATPKPRPVPTIGRSAGGIPTSISGGTQLDGTNQYSIGNLLGSTAAPVSTPLPTPTPSPTPTPNPLSLEERLNEKPADPSTPSPEAQQRLNDLTLYNAMDDMDSMPPDHPNAQKVAELLAEIARIDAKLRDLSVNNTVQSAMEIQMLMELKLSYQNMINKLMAEIMQDIVQRN